MKKTLCILSGIFLISAFLGAAEIVVTNPATGANWCQNSEHQITWTSSGRMDSNVKIILRTDRVILTISESTANDGSFVWRVPATLAPGNYFVRVKTVDNAVQGDSSAFSLCAEVMVARVQSRTLMHPASFTRTFTMPVTFGSSHKGRERHQWNCQPVMGNGPIPVPPTELLVGFRNRCTDRGPFCADECVSQIYRGNPFFDAARLRTLIGKNVIQATLSFRHKSTEAVPACAFCLKEVLFYSGVMGVWDPPTSEVRPVAAVPPTAWVRIDLTEWIRNWLLEKDPAYRGEHHNYHMFFVGVNERLDFNNQKCLSYFDNGSLEIKYRD